MDLVTWTPLPATYDENDNGKLDPRERRALPSSAFAFTRQRELPLVDEEFVREAIADFGPVLDALPMNCVPQRRTSAPPQGTSA